MNGIVPTLKEHWKRLHHIPKGIWLLLISYSLVVFGSPMPSKITWLEIVAGAGLLMAGAMLAWPVIEQARQHRPAKWCLILTALLFSVPSCIGFLRGNGLPDMLRDIFPLAFLTLFPILMTYSVPSDKRAAIQPLVVAVLVFVGICSAAMFVVGVNHLYGSLNKLAMLIRGGLEQVGATQATQATQAQVFLKLYDPSVLFTAIFLGAWGVVLMVRSWRGWLPGLFMLSLSVLIAYEFTILGLRAYAALFVLAIATIFLTQLRNRGLYIRLLPVLFVACVLLSSQIEAVLQLLWAKQQLVGSNGKLNEWLDVISTVFSSFQTALFGIGWGGVLVNSIYSNAPTRFTHSILSFYLLKTGTIGLGVLLTVIGMLFARLQKVGVSGTFDIPRLILLVSCIPPLLIGVLFETTYKMLSYGVILALFALALPKFEKKTR